MKKLIVPVAVASLALTSCATAGGTAMDRAWGQCGVAVVGGAVLGAIIGNNTGSGNARQGAGTGGLLGVGICGVLLAMASEEDKRRIREAEYAALETGQDREDSYVGKDGKRRTILVRTEDAPPREWSIPADATQTAAAPDQKPGTVTDVCRYRQTTLTVEDTGSGSLDRELVCRNPHTRTWEVQNA